MKEQNPNYKWYILMLVVLTDMFVIAIPQMGISVLAQEIADDLGPVSYTHLTLPTSDLV